jgi:hypothetical protein
MFIKSKLVLLTVSLLLSTQVLADRYGHGRGQSYSHGYNHGYNHNYNRGYNNGWIAPALIGGAVVGAMVYGATRPAQVYVAPAPVYVNPQIPYGFHYETIFDGNCNCYRQVLVQD